MAAIKITEQEKKAALFEVSFNRWKALKLFAFAFASFIVGLSALYWTLNYQYEQRLESLKDKLLVQFDQSIVDHQITAQADLYQGVVAYRGRADFDNVKVLARIEDNFYKEINLKAVMGQKRALAPGVYQVRFVKTDKSVQPFAPLP